jgi:serine/threonine protein kinase
MDFGVENSEHSKFSDGKTAHRIGNMADGEEEIVVCYACGAPMNIAAHPPYSRVVCPSCQTENRVKKQFGPYVLNRRHAIGGMSSVFVATDSTLDREVALKILSEEFSSDEKRISAFEDEARLTASFSHPNVVRVFTTGKAFGRLYIAMEFVPGGHFEHHIRERGRIPETEALPLAIQVAEGLKGAQAAGLIHRDVKPGNILLDSEGNAKLVDFGLALVTQGGKAKAEEIWATPYYVPPEAIEGGVEDFRADIYAFGATFYHALAGKPPCDEESMATDVLREAKKRIVPLKKAAPDLCQETCAVIDRAMAFDPANRFSSYDQMISSLHAALKVANGETVKDLDGITKAQRRLELRKKKQQNAFFAGAAAVLLAAGIGAFVVMKSSGSPAPKSKPTIIAVDTAPVDGQDATHRIAERYRSARAAMERGELRVAEVRFSALLKDGAVQEPTRTWAGLEAVVAAMMDGRMNDARNHASSAIDHIKQAQTGGVSAFQTAVLPVLGKLWNPGFIDHEEVRPGSKDSEAHMASLIAGLKNWEQGGLDQALPFFQEFANEPSLSQDNVLAWYQKAIKGYLRDYDKLKSTALQSDPNTPESCREAISELNELLALIETKGRARFNIRARQLDLAKLERALSRPQNTEVNAVSAPQDGEKLLKDIDFYAKGYRFAEIVTKLNEFEGDPPGCKRAALIVVSQASLNLLTEIEADLSKGAVDLPLTLKDGTAVVSLVVKDERLYSKQQTGEVREIRWVDLATDQIIKLNAELVKKLTNESDRTRRNESVIALDWLSGDRKRAVASAESLSEKSESFRKRWQVISPGLPD